MLNAFKWKMSSSTYLYILIFYSLALWLLFTILCLSIWNKILRFENSRCHLYHCYIFSYFILFGDSYMNTLYLHNFQSHFLL